MPVPFVKTHWVVLWNLESFIVCKYFNQIDLILKSCQGSMKSLRKSILSKETHYHFYEKNHLLFERGVFCSPNSIALSEYPGGVVEESEVTGRCFMKRWHPLAIVSYCSMASVHSLGEGDLRRVTVTSWTPTHGGLCDWTASHWIRQSLRWLRPESLCSASPLQLNAWVPVCFAHTRTVVNYKRETKSPMVLRTCSYKAHVVRHTHFGPDQANHPRKRMCYST